MLHNNEIKLSLTVYYKPHQLQNKIVWNRELTKSKIFVVLKTMGNCLKSTSNDDLTLLNGRANESNRESIDQEPNLHFPVSSSFTQYKAKKIFLYKILRNLPLFWVVCCKHFLFPCLRCYVTFSKLLFHPHFVAAEQTTKPPKNFSLSMAKIICLSNKRKQNTKQKKSEPRENPINM